MPVPHASIPTLHRLLRSALACLLLAATPTFAAKNDPPLRIPLENFGFQPLPSQFLLNGSSMLTLHYVDDKHLLLTFVVHRLIPRLPDEPEDDQDRIVDAVLLELPSGRTLARTSWHLHDHAQYLWNLGHGHFLLRVRDTLTTFSPLANLSTRDPFAQQPFLVSADRRLAALILSPEADLLIIETVKRIPTTPRPKPPILGPTPRPSPELGERDPVQINFYRIHSGDDGGPVQVRPAGAIQTPRAGDIPASTAGYLAVVDQGHQHWAFDFHSYSGKVDELSPFDSTCRPAPLFVSHGEFIAFGCHSGQNRQQLGGFNMRGEEMWEQGLFGDFMAPSIAYAPIGGRFALSRIMLRSSFISDQPVSADQVNGQNVVVYQTGTGKQLLRADCSPIQRAGQNFTLSPNGLALAVLHADAIEIYNLPPLTSKDESDIKLARSIAPPENNLPVRFPGLTTLPGVDSDPVSQSDPAANNDPTESTQPASPTQAQAQTASHTPNETKPERPTETKTTSSSSDSDSLPTAAPPPANPSSGDPAPEQQRHTPPTLYNLPDDKRPTNPPAAPKDTPQ
jgi:hypothetical protein